MAESKKVASPALGDIAQRQAPVPIYWKVTSAAIPKRWYSNALIQAKDKNASALGI